MIKTEKLISDLKFECECFICICNNNYVHITFFIYIFMNNLFMCNCNLFICNLLYK